MEKNKKYLILLIIVVILIITILCCILYLEPKNKKNQDNKEVHTKAYTDEIPVDTIYNAEEYEYYVINQYITNYLNALAFNNPSSAYQMLDETYAKENGITGANIISKLKISDKYQEYEAEKLYYVQISKQFKVYFVYGKIREKNSENGTKKEFDSIVNVDIINGTFSVIPYSEGLNHETIDLVNLKNKIDTIKKNQNNVFSTFATTENMKATKIFAKYISETLYYTNDAYEMLDEEYKNKRFGSIEKYKTYIVENQSFIKELVVDSYNVNKKNGYTEYRIMDNYGNMYIFNVTNLLNYTMKMDDYTIETEEFINKYNSSNIQNKVSLNIGKFFSMLNAKDYDSAYACLAEGFRQNYFPTVEQFKKYVENNFFKSNKLEGVSFENEGETYMLTVKISDYRGRESKVLEKTIIMQLREGTDFVMSFNVE